MIAKKLFIPAVLLLLSLPALRARWAWESAAPTVTLCLDGAELNAQYTPAELPEALQRYAALGVRSIAVAADGSVPVADALRPWTAVLPGEMALTFRPQFLKASEGGRAWREGEFSGALPRVKYFLPAGTALPPAGEGVLPAALAGGQPAVLFPFLEFNPAPSLAALARTFPDRVVRAHSVDEDEILRLRPSVVKARFLRAVRERGVRFLYVRLFPGLPSARNEAHVKELSTALLREGFRPGEAAPRFPSAPAAGGWPAAVRQAIAFLIAVLAPWGAFRFCRRFLDASPGRPAALAGLAVTAGLLIAALLSSGEFLLGLEAFRGVKGALLIPLFLVAADLLKGKDLRSLARKPVTLGMAALGAGIVLAALLYLLRSGNDAAVGASALERHLRESLEGVFGVRPRFKEFAVGYPLLWLAAFKDRGSRRDAAVPFLWWAGMVAPLSVVNTFCHPHVPLAVSLLRCFHGFWLGALFGAALIAVEPRLRRFWTKEVSRR